MLVLDDEIFRNVFRILEGMKGDKGRNAVDIISRVGPMGSCLAQKHTTEYFRAGEFRLSSLLDKRSAAAIERDGYESTVDRAKREATEKLAQHELLPLERDVDEELSAIVKSVSNTPR